MEEIKEILIENATEYFRNASSAESKHQFNTSVTLYFKAIATLCDIYILENEGKVPSNHTERFRILEKKYNKLYDIIDKDFSFYQDSYRTKLTSETSSIPKEDAKELFEILKIRI